MTTPIEEIAHLKALVDEQAKDEGLWFIAESVVEGYFQQELRKLHAEIESIWNRWGRP